MKSFFAAAIVAFLLAISSMSIADPPPQDLPGFKVTGNPCLYGTTCIFGPGMDMFLMEIPAYLPPEYDSIPVEDNSLVATCKSMRDRARQMACDVNNPPPVPSYPSPTQGEWASNGCGDGSWESALGSAILLAGIPLYTGDLTHPLPGVSFEAPCATHDRCYHTGFKSTCDTRLRTDIRNVCDGASSITRGQCYILTDLYKSAVDNRGQNAYDTDHRNMECAKISKALRNGECTS